MRIPEPLSDGCSRGRSGGSLVGSQPVCSRAARLWRAFSLVEIMVVVGLLSLIVLVLMTVFTNTQQAFRSGVTQTDILENSRAVIELITADVKLMTPSDFPTNILINNPFSNPGFDGVNFAKTIKLADYLPGYDMPLVQNLPGSSQRRTNLVEQLFWISRQNVNGRDSWVGTGYTVVATNSSPIFPLYRFVTNTPVLTDPLVMYNAFLTAVNANAFTNIGWSHLMDGVVDFRMQPYDLNGYWMINSIQYNSGISNSYPNTAFFFPPYQGVTNLYFMSNAIPGSVQLEFAALEDAVLRRAESFGGPSLAQSNYLAQQAGRTHVFKQRIVLPNVDSSAYP